MFHLTRKTRLSDVNFVERRFHLRGHQDDYRQLVLR
ncbi:hypothetical protein DESC_500163 [Desulfosarcina cetonica]|nr:hypothetical protein DESC_500163 [Desulfosarcina cetonica]